MLSSTPLALANSSIFLRSARASLRVLPLRYSEKGCVAIRTVCISYPSSSNFFLARCKKPIADSMVARSDVFLRLTPEVIVRILNWCDLGGTTFFGTDAKVLANFCDRSDPTYGLLLSRANTDTRNSLIVKG